jgi:quinol monooxygenase YgiN
MTMTPTNQRKIVRLTAADGAAERMRKGLITLQTETVREPGCVEFEFMQSLTAPHSFLLIEDFASPEALATHMDAPHTKAFFALGVLERGAQIEKTWLT